MKKPHIFMFNGAWRVRESAGTLCTLPFIDIRDVASYYGVFARLAHRITEARFVPSRYAK